MSKTEHLFANRLQLSMLDKKHIFTTVDILGASIETAKHLSENVSNLGMPAPVGSGTYLSPYQITSIKDCFYLAVCSMKTAQDITFFVLGKRLICCNHMNLYVSDWGEVGAATTDLLGCLFKKYKSLLVLEEKLDNINSDTFNKTRKALEREFVNGTFRSEDSKYNEWLGRIASEIGNLDEAKAYLELVRQVEDFRYQHSCYGRRSGPTYQDFADTIADSDDENINDSISAQVNFLLGIDDQIQQDISVFPWVPSMLTALLISEPNRNPNCFLSTCKLINIVIKKQDLQFTIPCDWQHILWSDEPMYGIGPMCSEGSYLLHKSNAEADISSNNVTHQTGPHQLRWRLTLTRQKEGHILLHWLHETLSERYECDLVYGVMQNPGPYKAILSNNLYKNRLSPNAKPKHLAIIDKYYAVQKIVKELIQGEWYNLLDLEPCLAQGVQRQRQLSPVSDYNNHCWFLTAAQKARKRTERIKQQDASVTISVAATSEHRLMPRAQKRKASTEVSELATNKPDF